MEDSCEMHSEDDKGHSEKKLKRIIKTRAQIDGLEKFYDEHKYPTETMKSELAQSLGLSEKQVSGWFCHRRLKDKRILRRETYGNGKQDRSSGVIQDRGSGFRQDSCGSTKQGDEKNFDHREVESRRLTGPELSAADVTYEVGTQYREESNHMEDTPSGSSSSFQDARFGKNVESFDVATSRYMSFDNSDLKSVKPRTGPSGYLKVKGRVENGAITAVKRQLGSLYRQDGPPLGVDFDPPPPGAFESSVQNPVNESGYTGEPVPAHAPDFSKAYKKSSSMGYGSISKTNSYVSDFDGATFKKSVKSAHPELYFNQRPGQNSSVHDGDHYYSGWNSSRGMHEGTTREMAVDSRGNYKFLAKHDTAEIKTSAGGFRSTYAGIVNGEQEKLRSADHNDAEEEDLECTPSNFVPKGHKYRYCPERELSRKDYIQVNRTAVDENHNADHMKIPLAKEMRVVKRARGEAPDSQEYMRNISATQMRSQTNHQMRSDAVMSSGFSDDDKTEETSSSES